MQVAIDELEAIGLGQALLRHCPGLGSFRLYDAKEAGRVEADVVIVKWPDYPAIHGRFRHKICWLKNPGWAAQVPRLQQEFDVVFSASRTLCDQRPELIYLPVACPDPAIFRPHPPNRRLRSEVCFVGNYARTGRPTAHVEQYLVPAAQFHFALWGLGWEAVEAPALQRLSRGRLRPERVPAVYASSQIVLINHGISHHQENMIATRVFEAMACEAFVISDYLPALEPLRPHLVFTTGGNHLEEQIRYFLSHPQERAAKVAGARARVLQHHTMAQRSRIIADRLQLEWVNGSPGS